MIPPAWLPLLAALNGQPLDGTPGVRDVDALCEHFDPVDDPDGRGDCSTDGHYLCAECDLPRYARTRCGR